MPKGTYQRLVDEGLLLVADGLRVPQPRQLWQAILAEWGKPYKIVCDRFRLADLQDAVKNGARIEVKGNAMERQHPKTFAHCGRVARMGHSRLCRMRVP